MYKALFYCFTNTTFFNHYNNPVKFVGGFETGLFFFFFFGVISHTSKLMLKILQASLQQSMNQELPGVQAGFRIGRGTRDQIANIC